MIQKKKHFFTQMSMEAGVARCSVAHLDARDDYTNEYGSRRRALQQEGGGHHLDYVLPTHPAHLSEFFLQIHDALHPVLTPVFVLALGSAVESPVAWASKYGALLATVCTGFLALLYNRPKEHHRARTVILARGALLNGNHIANRH
jgi:hypothetical protein